MANVNSYGMGQIRYVNDNQHTYLRRIFPTETHTNKNDYIHPILTTSISETKTYQDIIFYTDGISFVEGEAYHLQLTLPRNRSYDLIFDLKLLNRNANGVIDRNEYQEIKRFVVYRDSSGSFNYSRVILYPYKNGKNNADIDSVVLDFAKTDKNSVNINEVWYDIAHDKYFRKTSNSEDGWVELGSHNDTILNHSWKSDSSEQKATFDFVFSNKINGKNFNAILLELYRQSYDEDMQWIDNNTGKTYDGRHINLNDIEVTCSQIVNLVSEKDVGPFTNIGVWSHPDLLMSINGEEIRVGQSGYYELNDFNITNFGVVVNGPADKFTLDYQYKLT